MSDVLDTLFADTPVQSWTDGAALFQAGDVPTFLYRIIRGRVLLRRSLENGAEITLQTARSGDVLAEASAYAARSHCWAVAVGSTAARALPLVSFHARIRQDSILAAGWAAHLARAVQEARFRVEVRSFPTVSARLDAWLSDGNALPGKGQLKGVAAEIGVSREALYRELARRRAVMPPQSRDITPPSASGGAGRR